MNDRESRADRILNVESFPLIPLPPSPLFLHPGRPQTSQVFLRRKTAAELRPEMISMTPLKLFSARNSCAAAA